VRGLFRFLQVTDGIEHHVARVEIRLGEWTNMSKLDYDTANIEPTFWALPEEDSWREAVLSELPGPG
jgi:hypothetical protein